MAKKTQTPLGLFIESIGLYFSNFSKFVQYMSFPVLGQIAGLALVFLITFFYTRNLPALIIKFPVLNNFLSLILISLIITLPGLIIFVKAFWEYLVAYGAINSMVDNMLKSGKVYDFNAHTELIKRRTLSFIGLWFLFGIFSIFAVCPLFWIICAILAVYFVLVFQVFTYEPELSPLRCVKRSLLLVKGHFASTFMLMALAGVLTYVFIPQVFLKIFEITGINNLLVNVILPLVKELPTDALNNLITASGAKPISDFDIARFTIETFAAQILIQYTLPMRSILWAIWYKELNIQTEKTEKKTRNRRPSEKLMEESNKKYGSKKLDRNIIKRAMEKDDDV